MERRKFITLSGSVASITIAGCAEETDSASSGSDDSNGNDDSNGGTVDADASIENISMSHESGTVMIEAEVTTDETIFNNVLREESGNELDSSSGDYTFFEVPEQIIKHGGTLIYEVEIDDTVVDSEEVEISGYQLNVRELVVEASETWSGADDEYSIDEIDMTIMNEGDIPLEISDIEIGVGGKEITPFRVRETHQPGREYTYSASIINETLRTGSYTATVTAETTLIDGVGRDEAEVVIE